MQPARRQTRHGCSYASAAAVRQAPPKMPGRRAVSAAWVGGSGAGAAALAASASWKSGALLPPSSRGLFLSSGCFDLQAFFVRDEACIEWAGNSGCKQAISTPRLTITARKALHMTKILTAAVGLPAVSIRHARPLARQGPHFRSSPAREKRS